MRTAFVAISALCLLAACGQNAQTSDSSTAAPSATTNGGGGGASGGAGAPYRAEMNMTVGGRSMPAVLYRSGGNTRQEMDTPAGHSITIMNGDNHEAYTIMQVAGRTVAYRMDMSRSSPTTPPTDWRPEDVAASTQVGPCSAAGESGTEYTRTTEQGSWGGCVTSDGIMLRTKVNGATVLEATQIQRGPQDPSLFQLPPGVEAREMGNAGQMMQDAIAAAQAKGH